MSEEKNKKNVVAIGKFDGVHLGHQLLIKTAADVSKHKNMACTVYVVAPISSQCLTDRNQKEGLLKACGADLIIEQELTESFKRYTPEQFVKNILVEQLNAGHVAVGYNFRFGVNRSGDVNCLASLCARYGIEATVIDGVSAKNADGIEETISSTWIKRLLSQGNPQKAAEFLGRYYSMEGTISEGKHLGRSLGFPTVNIYPSESTFVPRFGVYAVKLTVRGESYRAVTNIGINPTVENGKNIKVESHILNYSGKSLYGDRVTLEFEEYVRPEIKFSDISKLKAQMEKDRQYIENSNLFV